MKIDHSISEACPTRDLLLRQFDISWALTTYHLDGLTDEECLWRPASRGLHVQLANDGSWQADWPDQESYDIGPPSIAWLTWHICFWWSMVLDHSNGEAALRREDVCWPGSAKSAYAQISQLQDRWRVLLIQCDDDDLRSLTRTRWPMKDRPFGDVVAWLNVELMKNAAEVGVVRFLYAAR